MSTSNISTPVVFPNLDKPWSAGITNRLEWDWTNVTKGHVSSDPTSTDNTPFYDGSPFSAFFHPVSNSSLPFNNYDLPKLQGNSGSVGVDVPKEVPGGSYAIQFDLAKQSERDPSHNITYAFAIGFEILPAVEKTVEIKSELDSSRGLNKVSKTVLAGFLALVLLQTVV